MPFGSEIQICELPPEGMMAYKRVATVLDFCSEDMDISRYWPHAGIHGPGASIYGQPTDIKSLIWRRLHWLNERQQLRLWDSASSEEEVRAYSVPLVEAFHQAARSYPEINVDPDVMAGAPCILGTRIPVYMILDTIEYAGSVQGALESYPRLTLEQVKEAVGFAKLVVECPIEHENTLAP
jgi:uncharacterized protein (DUF433 family)